MSAKKFAPLNKAKDKIVDAFVSTGTGWIIEQIHLYEVEILNAAKDGAQKIIISLSANLKNQKKKNILDSHRIEVALLLGMRKTGLTEEQIQKSFQFAEQALLSGEVDEALKPRFSDKEKAAKKRKMSR